VSSVSDHELARFSRFSSLKAGDPPTRATFWLHPLPPHHENTA
jgi:hypothetical protein